MYIRTKKHPQRETRTVFIAFSQRVKGIKNPRQILLKKIGIAKNKEQLNQLKEKGLLEIKEHGLEYLEQYNQSLKQMHIQEEALTIKGSELQFEQASKIDVGITDVFGALFEQLGFSQIMKEKHTEILKKLILIRLSEPGASKLKASRIAEKKFLYEISPQSIYRMMDELSKHEEEFQKKAFEEGLKRVKAINLVLYDVTTVHLESSEQDDLRDFGFSKNCLFNQTQIVLALASTPEGIPIGYKIFKGSTAECSTLIPFLEEWSKHVDLKEVIFVGDRAMMSEKNIKAIEEKEHRYIIAYPLKKLTKKESNEVVELFASLDKTKNHAREIEKSFSKNISKEESRKRIYITYCPKRAAKDVKDREKLIKKAQQMINAEGETSLKDLVQNRGRTRYLKVKDKETTDIVLDEDKIKNDASWDGLHGVITNIEGPLDDIYQRYRSLWIIEDCFRVSKTDLKIRPIRHFTANKIKAHFLICFITLVLMRHLQYMLKIQSDEEKTLSAEKILDHLQDVQKVSFKEKSFGMTYSIMLNFSEEAQLIYKAMNLSAP